MVMMLLFVNELTRLIVEAYKKEGLFYKKKLDLYEEADKSRPFLRFLRRR